MRPRSCSRTCRCSRRCRSRRGRRLGLAAVGYVASWDHTVGKGVISPPLRRYVVQNRAMREDLRRYHDIDPTGSSSPAGRRRTCSTAARPRERTSAPAGYGLDPAVRSCWSWATRRRTRPTKDASSSGSSTGGRSRRGDRVLAPLPSASSRHASGASASPPRSTPGRRRPGREPHRHRGARDAPPARRRVVSNAGTMLLDALVNDRPAVCVLYDEGAPPGETWAGKNVIGEHYRELSRSGAFHRAETFDEVVQGSSGRSRARRAGGGAAAGRLSRSSARSTVERRARGRRDSRRRRLGDDRRLVRRRDRRAGYPPVHLEEHDVPGGMRGVGKR